MTGSTGRMQGEIPVISPPRNPMPSRVITLTAPGGPGGWEVRRWEASWSHRPESGLPVRGPTRRAASLDRVLGACPSRGGYKSLTWSRDGPGSARGGTLKHLDRHGGKGQGDPAS